MNKYIKILALSSGLLAAIIPTAINTEKDNGNNDLNNMYQSVEKMQNIIPKLSKINYALNIDTSDNTLDDTSNDVITFSTTDENGETTELSKEETLTYLDATLEQTNTEYEQLKQCLMSAIKDTMNYLEQYKNNEVELSSEQKLYIKEHSNSIKFLAETLEDLSEELICVVDGCEDCDEDEIFESSVSVYLNAINNLEQRINLLHNTLSSLQLINNMSTPYLSPIFIPNYNIANESNDYNTTANDTNNSVVEDNSNTTQDENNDVNSNHVIDNNIDNKEIDSNASIEVEQFNDTDNSAEPEKPTTFGLKSNIDTYAPTRRNIDTFFNTALYNDQYMYGNNFMPYGYGGGYGMPYGNGFMGNPYGNGLNSNIINRSVIENNIDNPDRCENCNSSVELEDTNQTNNKTKKIRAKRAKNIDTYTGVTIQSNINTMGDSKISKFFKQKFNQLRDKVKNRKDTSNQNDLIDNAENNKGFSAPIEQKEIKAR